MALSNRPNCTLDTLVPIIVIGALDVIILSKSILMFYLFMIFEWT